MYIQHKRRSTAPLTNELTLPKQGNTHLIDTALSAYEQRVEQTGQTMIVRGYNSASGCRGWRVAVLRRRYTCRTIWNATRTVKKLKENSSTLAILPCYLALYDIITIFIIRTPYDIPYAYMVWYHTHQPWRSTFFLVRRTQTLFFLVKKKKILLTLPPVQVRPVRTYYSSSGIGHEA